MNADIKKRWVEALRSGKYQQITGQLKSDCGHCAMGVLADVVDPKGWKEADGGYYWHGREAGLGSFELSKIGLSYLQQDTIVRRNDNWKESFDQIATFVEDEL